MLCTCAFLVAHRSLQRLHGTRRRRSVRALHRPIDLDEVRWGDPAFDVQLRKEGFKSQTRSVTTSVSKEIVVELAKLESAAPPPPAPAPVAAPTVTKAPSHHDHQPAKKSGKKERDSDDIMTPSF